MSIINTALIGKLKKTKADKSNVLELDNLTSFTPSSDYHPATKKYVDDAVLGLSPDTNTYLASGSVSGNTLTLTLNDASTVDVDVSSLLDDTTNTLSSGTLSGNTITFTREDGTTLDVNVAALYDDTNLVTSVNGQTGDVTIAGSTDTYLSSGLVSGSTLRLTLSDSTYVDVDVSSLAGGVGGSGVFINDRETEDFTATAAQTVFNVLIGLDDVEVFYNGIKLDNEDYTVDSGAGTITLLEAAEAGDNIEVINYGKNVGTFDYSYNKTTYTVGTPVVGGYDGNLNTFPATYVAGMVDVYLNGLKLTDSEFTATSGTEIVLAADATSGDYIEIVGNLPVITSTYYNKTEVDALLASSDTLAELNDVNLGTPTDGQLLTWDNTNSEWINADAPISLPTQTGHSGEYLTTDGTNASWSAITQYTPPTDQGANTYLAGDGTYKSTAPFFDDTTNTVTSASLSGNTITFTREDATTFDLDVTNLYDDTNLVTSVNGQTGAVTISTDFLGLTDSPADYSGQADRVVKVKSDESGIEFGDLVAGSTVREMYTGDGIATDFTTVATFAGQNDLLVFVDAVIQYPGADFTLSGNTLSFLSAPSNGAEILLYGLTRITSVVTPGDGTVTAQKLAASAYSRDTFSGDNSTTSFTLTRDPGTVYSPFIYVDGVIQDPITHYNITGTTLTFTFTPSAGTDNITVAYGPTNVAATVSDGSITFDKLAPTNFSSQIETGDGSTTDFALDQFCATEDHVIVTVAGVPQAPDGVPYTITNNGNTLSFTSAPANGAKIVIRYYAIATYSAPADNTVTTASIQDGAITSDKIADGTVIATDVADGSITPAKLDREYATKGTSIALAIALG